MSTHIPLWRRYLHEADHRTNSRWFDRSFAAFVALLAIALGYGGYRSLIYFIWGH